MNNTSVAILCGGLATRLRPISEKIPKSMIEINGKPFMEYQLTLLKRSGLTNVVLCVGYLGEKIEQYFGDGSKFEVNIQYSYDGDRLLGTGGALKKALSKLSDIFLVMYGDSYLDLDYGPIINFFEKEYNKGEKKPLGLMTVYRNNNQYDRSNIVFKDGKIILYDKNANRDDMNYIDWGLSILTKEVFKFFKDKEKFSLEEIFKYLIKEDSLLSYEVYKRFYEIGSLNGLKEIEEVLKRSKYE